VCGRDRTQSLLLLQDKRYKDEATQAVPDVKEAPIQAVPETRISSSQYTRLTLSDSSTQASRVTHHVATQHLPLAVSRDSFTDTCCFDSNDQASVSDDSAIEVEDEESEGVDVGVQYVQDTDSRQTQVELETVEAGLQVEISDDKLQIALEELTLLKDHKTEIEGMLSYFYIPVQYSDHNEQVDLLKNFLNNLLTDTTDARCIPLHPTPPDGVRHMSESGFLTAANNSPASVVRRSQDTACNEEEEDPFSSFESGSEGGRAGSLQEELRLKLDLAYKVGSLRASHTTSM